MILNTLPVNDLFVRTKDGQIIPIIAMVVVREDISNIEYMEFFDYVIQFDPDPDHGCPGPSPLYMINWDYLDCLCTASGTPLKKLVKSKSQEPVDEYSGSLIPFPVACATGHSEDDDPDDEVPPA